VRKTKRKNDLPEPGRLITPDGTDLEKDGMILLYRYVKPFMRVVRGYGFKGIQEVRAFDKKALCKICGEWFDRVSVHVLQAHEWSHLDYKKEFGLSTSSSLDGEEEREQKIRVAKDSAAPRKTRVELNVFDEIAEADISESSVVSHRGRPKGRRDTRPRKKEVVPRKAYEMSVEIANRRGTCDLQLVTFVREAAKRLGRSPSPSEVVVDGIDMGPTIKNRLDPNWESVLAVCGLEPRWKACRTGMVPGSGSSHVTTGRLFSEDSYAPPGRFYTKADGKMRDVERKPFWWGPSILLWARLLYQRCGRWPSRSDLKRGNNGPNLKIINEEFGSFDEFIRWAKTNLHWKTILKRRKQKHREGK